MSNSASAAFDLGGPSAKENSNDVNRIARDIEQERERRMKLGLPSDEALFGHLPTVANDAARHVNKVKVLKEEEMERCDRMEKLQHRQFLLQIEREMNRRTALREMDLEQLRRVVDDDKHRVLDELDRVHQRINIRRMIEAERERLVVTNEDFPFGRFTEQKTLMLEQIISNFRQRVAVKAIESERQERILSDCYQSCVSLLLRKVSQRKASKAMDREREQRMFENHFVSTANKAAEAARLRIILAEINDYKSELCNFQELTAKARASSNFSSVMSQIERRANSQMALKLMDEEKARRVHNIITQKLVEEFERYSARKQADMLFDLEVARVDHKTRLEDVLVNLERRFKLKVAVSLMEAERVDRLLLPPSGIQSPIVEAIERYSNQRRANYEMDTEKERRVTQMQLQMALEDLKRCVARKSVQALVMDEHARAVHKNLLCSVQEELIRNINASIADQISEQERLDRMNGHPSMKTINGSVLEEIVRKGNQRIAKIQVQLEQERQILCMIGRNVHQELIRKVNRRWVDEQVAIEQSTRIVRMKAKDVFEELGRKRNRRDAVNAAECARIERHAKAQSDMHLRMSSDAIHQLHSQLEREFRIKHAVAVIEAEQETRVNHNRLDDVMVDLLRDLNRARVDRDMDMEKVRRIAIQQNQRVFEELERRQNRIDVIKSTEEERASRARHGHQERPQEAFQVLEEIQRHVYRKKALHEMEQERERRITCNQFARVLEQLERNLNGRRADVSADEERVRRVSRLLFQAVQDELRRHSSTSKNDAMSCQASSLPTSARRRLCLIETELKEKALLKMPESMANMMRVEEEKNKMTILHECLSATIEAEREDRIANALSRALRFQMLAVQYQPDIASAALSMRNRLRHVEEQKQDGVFFEHDRLTTQAKVGYFINTDRLEERMNEVSGNGAFEKDKRANQTIWAEQASEKDRLFRMEETTLRFPQDVSAMKKAAAMKLGFDVVDDEDASEWSMLSPSYGNNNIESTVVDEKQRLQLDLLRKQLVEKAQHLAKTSKAIYAGETVRLDMESAREENHVQFLESDFVNDFKKTTPLG